MCPLSRGSCLPLSDPHPTCPEHRRFGTHVSSPSRRDLPSPSGGGWAQSGPWPAALARDAMGATREATVGAASGARRKPGKEQSCVLPLATRTKSLDRAKVLASTIRHRGRPVPRQGGGPCPDKESER